MSPIDDELRTALQRRAAVVRPSPEPLAGIEQRARVMRRNRAASSVLASALVVAAVAVAVPALTPIASDVPNRLDVASTAPTPAPSPASEASPEAPPSPASSPAPAATPVAPAPARVADLAFSFADPWPYRGSAAALADGNRETMTRQWAATRGVDADDVELVPLYGEVYEPSASPQVVYAARVRGGEGAEVGVAVGSESGPLMVSTQPLPAGATLLLVPAPGDEVPRLLAVAAPSTRSLEYAGDGEAFEAMAAPAAGVGVHALEGPDPTVRVVHADGRSAVRAAPPYVEPERRPTAAAPDNLLDWGFRGQEDSELEQRAVRAYARSKSVPAKDVGFAVLLTADNDPGQRYTVLQAWTPGRPAQVVALVDHPEAPDELVLQPATDPDEPVVALLLTGTPGRTVDELVVLPAPGTGQVLYTERAGARARPVEPAPGLDGVVLIDRASTADSDRLTVLDDDGDLDRPRYDGTVAALLCGETGCG